MARVAFSKKEKIIFAILNNKKEIMYGKFCIFAT